MELNEYLKIERKKYGFILGLLIITVLAALLFMTASTEMYISDIPDMMYRLWNDGNLSAEEKIILYMRMPMVLMAVIAGMGLSISGAVMQSVTHNDLVSPFTLGISAAAAFGASVCIISGNSFLHTTIGMIAGAFISAGICILLVYTISIKIGESASAVVLIGIAMNYLFSAMSAVIQFFAQEYKLGEIVQWTFGTLAKATWTTVTISLVLFAIIFAIFIHKSLSLDAMALNDDDLVLSLGIDPKYIRRIVGFFAVLLTAAIISFTGVIGFVGLIAPHIARSVVGIEHRVFLPMTALVGALLLLFSDFIGRTLLYPVSVPVGIVVSFVGVPIFIHLVMAMKRR